MFDYWIALEAMFAQGEKSELTYKVSRRGAHFIGHTKSERLVVVKETTRSYEARSYLIHGGDRLNKGFGKDQDSRTLEQVVEETGEILSAAIACWLEPGSPHKVAEMDAELMT